MSRTRKDRPYRVHSPEHQWDYGRTQYTYKADGFEYNPETGLRDIPVVWTMYSYLQIPGAKTKKRKEQDTEYHWMSTPSWWNHLFNNIPQRRKGRAWERKVLVEEVDETDPPNFSKRPHRYYW